MTGVIFFGLSLIEADSTFWSRRWRWNQGVAPLPKHPVGKLFSADNRWRIGEEVVEGNRAGGNREISMKIDADRAGFPGVEAL